MSLELYQATQLCNLPSGEVAQFSYWLQEPGIADSTLADALLFAEAFHSALSADETFTALYDIGTIFSGYRVSSVTLSTGHVIQSMDGGTPFGGSNESNPPLPPQIAIVVTLRSALSSRRDRGRMYLPAPIIIEVGDAGRIDGSVPADLASSLEAAFLAGSTAFALNVVVYSRAGHSTNPCDRLEVGDVFDTQRRRRDKLIENRQNGDITVHAA